jgi:hypothetical protein
MSSSIYRGYGMHKDVATATVNDLTGKFRAVPPGTRHGIFLGVEFLRDLVADLDAGGFDGIAVNFGVKGAGVRRTFEVVATQLELAGGVSQVISKVGIHYASVEGIGPTPPVISSPPVGRDTY